MIEPEKRRIALPRPFNDPELRQALWGGGPIPTMRAQLMGFEEVVDAVGKAGHETTVPQAAAEILRASWDDFAAVVLREGVGRRSEVTVVGLDPSQVQVLDAFNLVDKWMHYQSGLVVPIEVIEGTFPIGSFLGVDIMCRLDSRNKLEPLEKYQGNRWGDYLVDKTKLLNIARVVREDVAPGLT